jgi:hypothetical protein
MILFYFICDIANDDDDDGKSTTLQRKQRNGPPSEFALHQLPNPADSAKVTVCFCGWMGWIVANNRFICSTISACFHNN